jgi:hypothetical protein
VFAGWWLGQERRLGIELGGFYIEPHATRFGVTSDGTVLIGRPFDDTSFAPPPSILLAARPNMFAGSINAATSNHFWGAEADGRWRVAEGEAGHFDLLTGFRYLQLKDDLAVSSASTPLQPPNPNGVPIPGPQPLPFQGFSGTPVTSLTVSDSFGTRNQFYGWQVGAEAVLQCGRLDLDLRGKVALGFVHEDVTIAGTTTQVTAAQTLTVPGGLLAQTTNIGHHNRDVFAAAPEFGVGVGYQITRHLHLQAGYSVVFLTNGVVRPGNQIDTAVDPFRVPALTLIPPVTPSPRFAFHDTDFWAHGLNAGLEWNF